MSRIMWNAKSLRVILTMNYDPDGHRAAVVIENPVPGRDDMYESPFSKTAEDALASLVPLIVAELKRRNKDAGGGE
jgi:hypothetical protein